MLTVQFIREKLDFIKAGLAKRNWSEEKMAVLNEVIQLDDLRKETQTKLDSELSKINALSKEIGSLFKSGSTAEANQKKEEVAALKINSALLEEDFKKTKDQLEQLLLSIPNAPNEKVPAGSTEEDNEVFKAWDGDLPDLGPDAIPHWELAEKYNLIDFKLGAFITGAGFPLFRGKGAKLERALINFFLNEASDAGYEEIVPPLLVNEASARGTGQLPDKDGQMYYCEKDDLYLIPTAEVPITNMYRGQILKETDFPIKLTGYTPCFRREAGSYGSDVKGLNRVHQFDKVEIVQLQHPDKSADTLMEMLNHVEGLLKKLELPYRILRLCGGDLSFASSLTYDFEVYSAAQKKWLEVSSVSNFTNFQSNRMKLRYKNAEGKTVLAHTLNGSALALARIVAAILENNQDADGIKIPRALLNYTGFERI